MDPWSYNYRGDLLSAADSPNYDPYAPIMNEPMGRDFSRNAHVSSLDAVTAYGYQPATKALPEESYYPSSMTTPIGRPDQGGDHRVNGQYEHMKDLSSLMPSYVELAWLVIILIIVIILMSASQNAKINELERKIEKLTGIVDL